MNKIISTILISGLLLSCNKFLDVKPLESVSDQAVITDRNSAEQALRGVYASLASDGYYGTSFQSIGYLSGDNIVWTGSQSQVQEFINKRVSAENSTVNAAWTAIYRTINRANIVISKIPEVSDPLLTPALRNQFVGEAYFLRALSYFDLARTWGGVPLILKPTTGPGDNSGIARASLADTYSRVLTDLDSAELLLPNTLDRFRATRKTVWALKSRYFLYQKDWTRAADFATRIITELNNYRLVRPYNSFFANNARGTVESIFEVFYNGTTEINTHRNQWQPQTNGGTRQWAPNDAFVALINNPVLGGNRNTLVARDNQNRWFGNLYYRNPPSDPSYVIRIAELFLIRAEAFANLNNLPDALRDLNAVRDRAGLTALTETERDRVLLAIENERRLEFAFEPHRWFDLVRTNRAQAVLGVQDPNRLLMPIPAQQIQLDGALVQNPGY